MCIPLLLFCLLRLLKHKQTYAYDRNFVLLDETAQHTYVAQSGLIGPGLPTHLTKYRLLPGPLKLEDGRDQLVVKLAERFTALGGQIEQGEVIGGIGASGGTIEEDCECCLVGMRKLGFKTEFVNPLAAKK